MVELEREYEAKDAVELASNEHPWGPSPRVLQALQSAIGDLNRYPDGSSCSLSRAVAKHFGVLPGEVVLGKGSPYYRWHRRGECSFPHRSV